MGDNERIFTITIAICITLITIVYFICDNHNKYNEKIMSINRHEYFYKLPDERFKTKTIDEKTFTEPK